MIKILALFVLLEPVSADVPNNCSTTVMWWEQCKGNDKDNSCTPTNKYPDQLDGTCGWYTPSECESPQDPGCERTCTCNKAAS